VLASNPLPVYRAADLAWRGSPAKRPRYDLDRRAVVVYTPSGASWGKSLPGVSGLGFIEAIIGAVGSIIGGNSAAKAASKQAKFALQAEQIKAQSAERIASTMLEAEKFKASQNYQIAALEADAVGMSVRTQRAVMIDQQATQLVANTQNGIFRLSSVGISEASSATQSWSKSAVLGAIVVTGLFMLAANPPKFGSKKGAGPRGEFFRRDMRRQASEPASEPTEASK